jgi:hypothetical protein
MLCVGIGHTELTHLGFDHELGQHLLAGCLVRAQGDLHKGILCVLIAAIPDFRLARYLDGICGILCYAFPVRRPMFAIRELVGGDGGLEQG